MMMPPHAIDPEHLRVQYSDNERLRVRLETHQRYSERPDDFVEWVLHHATLLSSQRLLDVGCGDGGFHAPLRRRGVRVVGVDRSAGMLRAALASQGQTVAPIAVAGIPPAAILQGDAQALPIDDATFDRALAAHVLFHVPDVLGALRELRRVRRPGGRVVLTTNAADHSQRLYALHAAAALALGYTPTEPPGAHFTLDHLALVQEVFPGAERHIRRDAFLFPDAA
ncbi:MAG: class I SAM-dependent methyltransferase, partial [Chloroflexota bacterium]|nr:class I SAM-dependent methyltransferase [Chloroflexota bacterium]